MTEDKAEFGIISDFGSLYTAYRKSKSGKKLNKDIMRFQMAAFDGVYQLSRLLETQKYKVSPYRKFEVYEPKRRLIEAGVYKDQIVQHSLCDNVLIPALEKEFIRTNYAGQLGKGTLYGLNCLGSHMKFAYEKYGNDCWIVKADISKYFYSIDHSKLKDMIGYYIHEERVRWLCDKFIGVENDVGLPLGNQVTQVYALLFLSGLDHFITGELGIEYYGRYMDDFYLIVESKEYAKWCLECIREFISSLGLELNGKTQIIPFKNGIKFCGFHTYITKDGKPIRKLTNEKKREAKKRYRKMIRAMKKGKISKEKLMESYQSWKNHISHGNCVKFGHQMDLMMEELMKTEEVKNE